jgi:hypothetical protein
MTQQLDEGNFREPFQHRKPAAARAVDFINDLINRRAEPCGITGRTRAHMHDSWQRVAKRAKVQRVTMQIAAQHPDPLRLTAIAEHRDLPPRLGRQIRRRYDQPAAAACTQLVSGSERKRHDISRLQNVGLALHFHPAGALDHDVKRDHR